LVNRLKVFIIYTKKNYRFFQGDSKTTVEESVVLDNLNDSEIEKYISEDFANQLRDDITLIDGVYDDFDKREYLKANVKSSIFWKCG
jgi:peptide chain release factor 3